MSKVFIEDKINILEKVKSILKGGHIAGVYSESDSVFAENVLKELTRDYRLTKKKLPHGAENDIETAEDIAAVDDDVRLFIGFGGENIAEVVRYASMKCGIPYIIVLTSPFNALSNKSYIFKKGVMREYNCSYPEAVIGYKEYLLTRDGYEGLIGDIALRILTETDNYVKHLVSGKRGYILSEITSAEKLADTLTESDKFGILSYVYKREDHRSNATDRIPYIIARNEDGGISSGIYKFVITYIILLKYLHFINYDGEDLLYPPDITGDAISLAKKFRIPVSEVIIGYRAMTHKEYEIASHIIREYADELTSHIKRCISVVCKLSKLFRRITRDAGFSLKQEINTDDMLNDIALLSLTENENTLLKIMKTSGWLEKTQ